MINENQKLLHFFFYNNFYGLDDFETPRATITSLLTLWCTNELWMGILQTFSTSLLFPFRLKHWEPTCSRKKSWDRWCVCVVWRIEGSVRGANVVEWEKLELILLDGTLISFFFRVNRKRTTLDAWIVQFSSCESIKWIAFLFYYAARGLIGSLLHVSSQRERNSISNARECVWRK